MRKLLSATIAVVTIGLVASPAQALIMGVSGPNSSAGTAAAIIAAPPNALDDIVFNTGMEGFNEAQGVVTTVAHATDGGFIPLGTRVNSHMIFLNSQGTASLSHFSVAWTFDGAIIGVMSDSNGNLEAASTFELGAPGTNYTVTFSGSGPAAPFAARGLEANDGEGDGPNDGYMLINPFTLLVGMYVTEPGDWIRVVTATPVPEPSSLVIFGLGMLGLGMLLRRRRVTA